MKTIRLISLTLVFLIVSAAVPTSDVIAVPQAPNATKPDTLVAEPFQEWTVGGGFIYWAERCSGGIDRSGQGLQLEAGPTAPVATATLRRLPIGRGQPRTLVSIENDNCVTFLKMVADDGGIYYYNESLARIEMVGASPPPGPKLPVIPLQENVSEVEVGLVADDTHLYFASNNQIMRTAKDGSGGEMIHVTGFNVKDVAVDNTNIYWTDDDGLWFGAKSCTQAPCDKTKLTSNKGNYILLGGAGGLGGQPRRVYLVRPGTFYPQIVRFDCSILTTGVTCGSQVLHNGAFFSSIGKLVQGHTGSIFSGKDWLYWTEAGSTGAGVLYRMPIEGGTAEDLYDDASPLSFKVFNDSTYIYFADIQAGDKQILRLPEDADPLQRDIAFDTWEVVQSVQSMNHDVPLIAEKTTFVRVFGKQLSGVRSSNVQAILRGFRNGQELSGSPVVPVKNLIQALQIGQSYDRLDEYDGWLFRLPKAWTLAGELTLRVEVNPKQHYVDSNPGNNSSEDTLIFNPSRAMCVVFVPVLTDDPLPSSADNPNFQSAVDLAENLWPVSRILPYQHQAPLTEDGGPFEMEDDEDKVLKAVKQRLSMSIRPPGCPPNALLHFVGMVNDNAADDAIHGGAGYIPEDPDKRDAWSASWVLVTGPDPSYDEDYQNYPALFYPIGPFSGGYWSYGVYMAHELAHNRGRNHVQCDIPQDSPFDPDWPYQDPCSLDDADPDSLSAHFGFHARLLEPVDNDAADMMTYDPRVRWISDYTYKAILEDICPDSNGCLNLSNQASRSSLDKQEDQGTMLIIGWVDAEAATGEIDPVWTLPNNSVSAAVAQSRGGLTPGSSNQSTVDVAVKLFAADGALLATQTVIPVTIASESDVAHPQSFSTAVDAPPEGVARLELWVDGVIVDTIEPGSQAPVVAIAQPEGGMTVDAFVEAEWTVSDPDGDEVLYTVQYSPDAGAAWYTVADPRPAAGGSLSTTFDLSNLPGSQPNQAQLRVIASDGLNTTIGTSPFFPVVDHKPQVMIGSPAPNQIFSPTEPVILSGQALDPEEGSVQEGKLSWTLNGKFVGNGSLLQMIGLAPGHYEVELAAEDTPGNLGIASTTFMIDGLELPSGNLPYLDGYCDDNNYVDSEVIALSPYDDGGQATARLQLNGDHFWVCFSGLQRGTADNVGRVTINLDPNYSRDETAQAEDFRYSVYEDGTLQKESGDQAGGWQASLPSAFEAKVSANGNSWQAEFRIPNSFTEESGHTRGMALAHKLPASSSHTWPMDADANGTASPKSWATTYFGARAAITQIDPGNVLAGSAGLALTLSGEGFLPGAQISWDGELKTTQYISETTLTTEIGAGYLGTAGVVDIQVINPGYESAPSQFSQFTIENPVPSLTSISPQEAEAGSGPLTLTVLGGNFGPDTYLVWNGQVITPESISSGEMQVQIDSALLGLPGPITVLVHNGGPGGGSSAALTFSIHPNDDDSSQPPLLNMYLPVVLR